MLGASKSIWGFDPRSIPGCSIWFDAADTSTITTSGTNVTSWTNKGSIPLIAYPLTGGLGTPVGGGTNSNAYGGYMTSGTSTVNGLNAVSCPIQTTYGMNSTVTFPAQARAVFAVYKATVLGSSSQYLTFFGCATVTPNNQNGMDNYIYYDGQSATLFAEVGAGNGSVLGASTAAGTIPLNTTGMVCWVQSAVSTGSNFITLNGVSQSVTTNAIASTYVTTPQYYFIGCSYPQSCLLCEYIMINAEMTIPQRQSMEGYLARKWGITLPTTHPFYGTLPFNRYFNPTDLPGCSLWLDAADNSTMNSTTTVTSWSDKSGLNNTMTGTATWTGSNMTFNGSTNAFSNTTYVFPSNAYSMFGVYSNTTAPAASAYMNAVYGSNGFPMLGIYGSNKYVSARSVVANTGALSTTVGWAARIGGTGTDSGRAVATDSSGNVLVTGNFTSGSLNFYNSSGVSNASLASAGTGSNSCFIGKYTSAGAVSWAAKIGGTLDDYGYGIATDLNGNVFVTGFYNSSPVTVYDSSGVSNASLANAGSSDIFLVKYTSSGSFSWAARMAGASIDSGRAVATDSSGNVFVAGHTSSLILYDSSGVSNASIVSYSAFVAKYTSTGSVSWVVGMGGTGGINVTIDSSGNVLVTGNFTIASLKFYNSSGVSNASISNSGSSDIFIAKYTSSGSFSWAVHIGGTGADYEYGVATDSSGNVFVTGSYASTTLTFYDSSGVSNASLSNSGVNDCFIAKYTSVGAVSWVAKIGGTGDDDGYGIATDLNGNVFVTGLYSAALTMYNTSGTAGATLGNVGGTYDGFVAKYTSAGAVSWAVQIAGAGADRPYGITTDSSGNVLVTGSYASTTLTFYDSSGVSNASLSTTGQNVFIAKYSPDGYITAPVPASSNVLVSATYASSTFSPFVNGSNTSTLAGATTATTGIYVGGPSNYFNGSISELLIYSSTLSAAQRQQVEGYLIQKWGLSTQTVTGHQYKLIPPATSQPAQFAEVTPGNWARDWNPYLQSLIATNNPTNATVIPTVSYGTNSLSPALSTQQYYGGVLAPNGNIYCVPYGASNILIINTTTNAVSYGTGGSSLSPTLSLQAYGGGVLAPNGNIYCVPGINGNTSNILIINTTTNAVSYGTGGPSLSPALSTQYYVGGVLAPNGNIYCMPGNTSNILIINTTTNAVSYGTNGPSLSPALSTQVYYGGVLAPNGNIYCIPRSASNVLIINTTTNAVSYGTGGNSLSPALSAQRYIGGVLAPNGNIYCMPGNTSNILIINTTTNAVSYATGTNSLSPALSTQGYYGGVLAPNGNIYCVPNGASNILIINTTTNAVSYGSNSLSPALSGQTYQGGVLAPNGNIYCVPTGALNILIISNAYTQNPSSNYCLSAFVNKL